MIVKSLPENERMIHQLAQANNAFAVELYRQLASTPGNLFLSPHSISRALAMTYAGAGAETARQMKEALHFELPVDRLGLAFAALQELLAQCARTGEVELSSASSLWLQQGYELRPEFLQLVQDAYQAGLNRVDYAQPEPARQAINAWVAEATRQRIQDLVPCGVIKPLTRLVLANAIYFKGLWASQFDAAETTSAPFLNLDGSKSEISLMDQKAEFAYAKFHDLQALELPYQGDDLAMIILLPDDADGLPPLEASLTTETLARWTGDLRAQELHVFLPRFQVSASFRLDEALQALGMPDAFSETKADFSAMDPANMLYISAVLHKAFCEVNEQGSEAAAASAVVMALRSLPLPPPVFRADHPFLFLIRHRPSGVILFIGRLSQVTKE
jgi:serpin B